MSRGGRTPDGLRLWTDARKRHRLSPEQVQMAANSASTPKSSASLTTIAKSPGSCRCRHSSSTSIASGSARTAPTWCSLSKTPCAKGRKWSGAPLGCDTINFRQLPRPVHGARREGALPVSRPRRTSALPRHKTQPRTGHKSLRSLLVVTI